MFDTVITLSQGCYENMKKCDEIVKTSRETRFFMDTSITFSSYSQNKATLIQVGHRGDPLYSFSETVLGLYSIPADRRYWCPDGSERYRRQNNMGNLIYRKILSAVIRRDQQSNRPGGSSTADWSAGDCILHTGNSTSYRRRLRASSARALYYRKIVCRPHPFWKSLRNRQKYCGRIFRNVSTDICLCKKAPPRVQQGPFAILELVGG